MSNKARTGSKPDARLTLVISREELVALEAVARASDRSLSAETRRALRLHVERAKSAAA
jgi:hypothetical protein